MGWEWSGQAGRGGAGRAPGVPHTSAPRGHPPWTGPGSHPAPTASPSRPLDHERPPRPRSAPLRLAAQPWRGSRSDPRGRPGPRHSVRAWGGGQALGPAPGAPQRLDTAPYAPGAFRGQGNASLIPKGKAPPRPHTPASPLPEPLPQGLGFQPGTPGAQLHPRSPPPPRGSPHASTSPRPPPGSSCIPPEGMPGAGMVGQPSLRQPSRPSSQATGRCER